MASGDKHIPVQKKSRCEAAEFWGCKMEEINTNVRWCNLIIDDYEKISILDSHNYVKTLQRSDLF